jgi:hypothetical protein
LASQVGGPFSIRQRSGASEWTSKLRSASECLLLAILSVIWLRDLFVSAELSGEGSLRVALILREFPQYPKT